MSAHTARAGDREWATVGKVLTGMAAGVVIAKTLDCEPTYVSASYSSRGCSSPSYSVSYTVSTPAPCPPPRPVYVAPPVCAPPPVIYAPAPAPVVYAPAPVVVYRPVVCAPPPAPVYRVTYVNPGRGHDHGRGYGYGHGRR
jgi:hypothetical protein